MKLLQRPRVAEEHPGGLSLEQPSYQAHGCKTPTCPSLQA
jgi:hypothetical protein